jgi:hypothetical protein
VTVSELIAALQEMQQRHGNLPVQGVWDFCQFDIDSIYLAGEARPGGTDPANPVIIIDVDQGQARDEIEFKR